MQLNQDFIHAELYDSAKQMRDWILEIETEEVKLSKICTKDWSDTDRMKSQISEQYEAMKPYADRLVDVRWERMPEPDSYLGRFVLTLRK